MIDVRWPQQRYTRAVGWVGRRLPLLQRLLARNADGERRPIEGGTFVYRTVRAAPRKVPKTHVPAEARLPATYLARSIPLPSVGGAGNDRPTSVPSVHAAATGFDSSVRPLALARSTAVARPAEPTTVVSAHRGGADDADTASAIPRSALGAKSTGAGPATSAALRHDVLPSSRPFPHDRLLPADPSSPGSSTATASVFPRRLALRASSPPGVIDLQRSAQHYSRAAGWSDSSLPLLSRLLNRGRSDSDLGTGVRGGRVAAAESSARPDSVTIVSAFVPPADHVLSLAASVAPGEAQQWQAGGSPSLLRVTATEPRGASATVARFADHRSSAAPETESPVQAPPVLRVRRRAVPSADAGSILAGEATIRTKPVESTRQSPGHAAEAGALAAVVFGKAPANRRAPTVLPVAPAPQPLLRRKAIASSASSLSSRGELLAAAITVGAPAPTATFAVPEARPPGRSTGSMRPPATTSEKVVTQLLPVIPQRTALASAAASALPGLVLQRKGSASAVAPAGNREARAATTRTAVGTHHPAHDGPLAPGDSRPAKSQPGAPRVNGNTLPAAVALDWEQLTAEVSRRLLRHMSIERERRGWKQWN